MQPDVTTGNLLKIVYITSKENYMERNERVTRAS